MDCVNQLAKYSAQVNTQFCKGLNIRFVSPDQMNSNDLLTWSKYKQYKEESIPYEQQQLIYVWMGLKPVTISAEQNDVPICGVKTLRTNNLVIYFTNQHWLNAIMLYMYYEKLFDTEVLSRIDYCFNEFEGILLGYTSESIIDNELGWDIYDNAYQSIPTYANKGFTDKVKEFMGQYEFSPDQVRKLYAIYYGEVQQYLPQHTQKYEYAVSLINYLIPLIQNNPIYQMVATQTVPPLNR